MRRIAIPSVRWVCDAAATAGLVLAAPAIAAELRFREVAAELGIRFEHRHFGTGEKYMPENMGVGVAVFDYDGDGRLDLFFPQGAPLAAAGKTEPAPTPATFIAAVAAETREITPEPVSPTGDRLFHQRPDGTFEDTTAKAGIVENGYGMGATFGDVDRDGDLDLYVTNFGPNVLWRNRGDGTFEDATSVAGVATAPLASGATSWSSAAGFFDADADGDLDLYVARYLEVSFDRHKFCGNAQARIRAYCHPDVYDGAPDVLFRNDGRGRFTDVSREAGLLATPNDKGLGILLHDLDGDGAQDIYVANDSTPNYLYLGDGQGRFREQALLAGVAVDGSGAPEASMGVELGDLDGDGLAEIFLTHLDQETNTLYRSIGRRLWTDATDDLGLGAPSLPWVGFGTAFFDPDDDGDLDVFVANGHIIDNIEQFEPSRSHRQPAQLFVKPGRAPFVQVPSHVIGLPPLVGRGAVAADLDRDGDEDLVIAQNGDRALVLRNETPDGGGALVVRLRGTRSNAQGFGARVELHAADRVLVRWMKSSTSYLSQGPPELHFGLGDATRAHALLVRWPSGHVDSIGTLDAGQVHVVTEGSATVESSPLGR